MSLPKCIWGVILKEANWFPARRVNRAFCDLVDAVYEFKKRDCGAICSKSTPKILKLFSKQYDFSFDDFIGGAYSNSQEMVNYFIKKGADYLHAGISHACATNNTEAIYDLIKQGFTNWRFGFAEACKTNNLALAKIFMAFGNKCRINLFFKTASFTNNLEIVKYLIAQGANCWTIGLKNACLNGNLELANLMLAKGAKCNGPLIHTACRSGNLELVKLVSTGVTTDWNLCLSGARGKEAVDIVNFLLEKGANDWNKLLEISCEIGSKELFFKAINNGATKFKRALGYATYNNHYELVKILLEKNVDPNIYDALHWTRVNYDIIKLFLQYRSDIMLPYAVRNACYNNNKELLDLCLEKGFDNWGFGLYHSCLYNNFSMAKFFVNKGVRDINMPFIYACNSGNFKMVKYFIEKGANEWNFGLEKACVSGNIKIIELLIAKGADDWQKGLRSAKIHNHNKIIKLIKLKYA